MSKPVIGVGARVRLRAPHPILALRSDVGIVVRPDMVGGSHTGYWIVRLDAPADYVDADGDTRRLQEIRENPENLVVLDSAS